LQILSFEFKNQRGLLRTIAMMEFNDKKALCAFAKNLAPFAVK